MAEMKINVSFKVHEKELFDFIKGQRSPSNYIKDAVEFYRTHGNGIQQKKKTPQNEEPSAPSNASSMLEF